MKLVGILLSLIYWFNLVHAFKPYKQNKDHDVIFFDKKDLFINDFQNHEKTTVNGPTVALTEMHSVANVIQPNQVQFYTFTLDTSIPPIPSIGAYFVYISGNICVGPQDSFDSLTVTVSLNSSLLSQEIDSTTGITDFIGGYFYYFVDITAEDIQTNDLTVYIGVTAPENNNQTLTWNYEIAASQQNSVYQYDVDTFVTVVDSDDDSTLIVTNNLTYASGFNVSNADPNDAYSLYIYEYSMLDYFQNMTRSWCSIRNGPYLTNITIQSDFISHYSDGTLQQQFYISGLTKGTQYVGYLTYDFGQVNSTGGSNSGGIIYEQFQFETLSTQACEIIFGLSFCDKVAYAVPQSSSNSSRELLMATYDNYTEDLFQNFTYALQQIPCDTIENAIFSPITSCANCSSSYKDWLCSVTIPRCSSRNITGYKYRDIGQSRNDLLNNVIQPQEPYFEVLPCIDVCQSMVRNCPVDFGFQCPITNASIALSYYWTVPNSEYPTCNYMGDVVEIENSSSLKSVNLTFLMVINMILMVWLI
ncbi:stretch-activated Ca2+-permeable channel component-domain-containing protein [Scheffersomyces coipomensis]|uniref:stretch-activated Ca2+-permeable channel component-domain-containing protein n=1 Tax=Scheffersomyces coipomensis TaxID=1788519 RepID=UPI00315C8348